MKLLSLRRRPLLGGRSLALGNLCRWRTPLWRGSLLLDRGTRPGVNGLSLGLLCVHGAARGRAALKGLRHLTDNQVGDQVPVLLLLVTN